MSPVASPPGRWGAPRRRRWVGWLGGEPWLAVLVGVTALVDATASIVRHVHLQSGLDLAIFDQAVWHYSRFEAPFSSIKGENLLGDHFHPLVAGLAPLYWIWSDPRMLLIAQALLVAASIVPVFLFARDRLGRAGAYLLAGAYAAFWGLQVGVAFDFHEVALAPLLIALAVLLADRRRWGWFWLVVVLILGIKEDLSLFVVFFGLYLLSLRQVRQGVALVVVGVAWYELATRVLVPHFSDGVAYAYWSYGELGKTLPDAVWALVRAPWRVLTIGLSPAEKWHTIAALFAPFLLLTAGSRLIILAIPLLAERFLSTNADFWGTDFHYSMAISPVLAMGAAAGLANVTRLLPEHRHRAAIALGAATMLLASLAITRIGHTNSAVGEITARSSYTAPSYAAPGDRALARVPPPASLATTDSLLAHASQRRQLDLIEPLSAGRDRYLVVNVLHVGCCGATGNRDQAALGRVLDQELRRTTPVHYDAGWLVARRPGGGQASRNGVLTPMNARTAQGVDRLIADWHGALAAAIERLWPCYPARRAHEASAPRCFAAALGSLPDRQRRLRAAIGGVLPGLGPGCAELARGALGATRGVMLDLERIAAAGAARSAGDPVGAFVSFQRYEAKHDPIGLPDRFAILCTPRT